MRARVIEKNRLCAERAALAQAVSRGCRGLEALVLVTHDLDLARRCNRVLFMEAGRIEREAEGGSA